MSRFTLPDLENSPGWLVFSWVIVTGLAGVVGFAIGMLVVAIEFRVGDFIRAMNTWLLLLILLGLLGYVVACFHLARQTLRRL